MRRRDFLALAAGGVAASAWGARWRRAPASPQPLRAVAFDAFAIFDPRPIGALAESLFPGRGTELGNAWRTRQFEYQWLRALSGHYADFWQTTQDALIFAARSLDLRLTPEAHGRLMQAWLHLDVWPDVPASLAALKEADLRLAFLSNMTTGMLKTGIENAGLDGVFEHVLSTDTVTAYKPDPRAYRMAIDAFDLPPWQVLFAAFAGWDAAGARWFGYPTFWVNRLGVPGEELGVTADAAGGGLQDLVAFALEPRDLAHCAGPRPKWNEDVVLSPRGEPRPSS
jgi:2-haloacid dehalogenase